MNLNTIPSAIAGAISNTYNNTLSLLKTILKSKKVNASAVIFLLDCFIVLRPEFESLRPELLQITTLFWGGIVGPFAVVDVAMAVKKGESKYFPKSA